MGLITLEGCRFHSKHGVYLFEKESGSEFIVDLFLETDLTQPGISDDIKDTLNYEAAYTVMKKVMNGSQNLLESLAHQILEGLFDVFPTLESAKIKVSKLSPPLGGPVRVTSVVLSRKWKADF